MILLISGSINAGKTTVAAALTRMLPRAAHVEVDALYDFIRPLPLAEAIPINLENAALVARNLARHGFDVILTYPLGADDHAYLVKALAGCGAPIHTFTLSPPLEVAAADRGGRNLLPAEVVRIHEQYADGRHRPAFGVCVDNSRQTPEETARLILETIADVRKEEPTDGAHARPDG